MTDSIHRRVVVTGLGVVAPNGIGKEAFWRATSKGVSGIKPISRISLTDLPITVAGEVADFKASDYIDRKLARNTDRMTHLAFAAIQEALQDANIALAEENPHRTGAVIANTLGGIEYVVEQFQAFFQRGPRYVSSHTAIAWLPVSNVGQISIRYGIQGYSKTPVNDTVGGLDALGIAYDAVRRGVADVIIAGGSEAFLQREVLLVMARSGECAIGDDPHAYRPFDRRARGLLLAEGAGMCIVEEYEYARRRGASICGEIVGYGQSNDAHWPMMPAANGTQYARAMRLALQEGQLSPHDIGYFNLDGRALPISDQNEAEALHLVFGNRLPQLPVSVPRTMLGHSFAAAGVLDTITALIALQMGIIPPTINSDELNPRYELNLVQNESRPLAGSAVLIGGRGISGANVVLALKKGDA
jgi:3-oxoacyl-(acyl-carrier-protein) synthase